MSDGSAFSNAFMGAYQMMSQRAKEEQDKKDLMKSYAAFAGVNDPPMSTTSPVTQQTQVPVAMGAIPGQSGNTQEPSAPVQAPATQMQTETLTTQKEDQYKVGIANIKSAYNAKIKQVLPQMKDPRVLMQFIHQATTERDTELAQHNSASFQQDLMGLMSDDTKTPVQKIAAAVGMNAKYKVGMPVNSILDMFKGEKPVALSDGGVLVDPRTGRVIAQAPRKEPIYTPYQRDMVNLKRQEIENKEPQLASWEKEHHNYEKGLGVTDASLFDEYQAITQDPASSTLIEPKDQAKFNAATQRINGYVTQPKLTSDEQTFLAGIDKSKVSKEEGFRMLQQYRMNKLHGIRQ